MYNSKDREYMKKYMLARYYKRREEAMAMLGNKCSKCGSVKDLEFDHKFRATKDFTIAKFWSVNKKKFWEEIEKCQLLCRECHAEKTLKEVGKVSSKLTHGTISSYRYCKCELCRAANTRAWKAWHNKQWTRSSEEELLPFKESVGVS